MNPDETKRSRTGRLLPLLIIAAIAMTAGIWSARQLLQSRVEPDELASTRFPVARQVESFALSDHNGNTFDNAALRDRWSFLFFGYTHCPDVCPITLNVLNSVAQRLGDDDAEVRFIFVTIDPERDTPELLARFVTYFNGDFVGVTGSADELEQFTKQLGVLYMRTAPEGSPEGYLMDHSAAVFLFDPGGRYHAVFTPPLSADTIAGDFNKMLEAYR
jgi:protein SCO1/2